MKKRILLPGALLLALSITTVTYAFTGATEVVNPHTVLAPHSKSALTTLATTAPAVKEQEATTARLNQKIFQNEIHIVPLALYEDLNSQQLRVAYMNKDAGMVLATVIVGNETDFAGKRITLTKITPNASVDGGYEFIFSVTGAPKK